MVSIKKIRENIEGLDRKSIGDLDRELMEVRLSMGTDLTDKIESMKSKYMKKAGLIGSITGLIGGVVAGFIYDANKKIPMGGEVLIEGLMGSYLGLNLGEMLGLFYSNYQSRKLMKENPEYAEEIKRYNRICQSQIYSQYR